MPGSSPGMTRLRHEVTVYSVYEPASDDDDIAARADRIAFVKDGFSWLALIVPALWLLYHRMWIEFIVFMALIFGLQWAFGADQQRRGDRRLAEPGHHRAVRFRGERSARRHARAARLPLRRRGHGSRPPRGGALVLLPVAAAAGATAIRRAAARNRSRPAPSRRRLRAGGEGDDVIGLFPQG